MRISRALSIAVLALLLLGCDDDGTASSSASFSPETRTPAPNQVFLAIDATSASSVAVSVRVRGTAGVHAADLTLTYDPVRLVFRSSSPGTLLEEGNSGVSYAVRETTAGTLRIEAERVAVDTVDAGTDDPALVVLAFDVVVQGNAAASFTSSSLLDENGGAIPGISFFGGTFVGY